MDRASSPVGYRLAKAVLSRPLRRAYDIEIEGDTRLPDGPVVLAANHRSFMDSIFLALVVDRAVSFLAKADAAGIVLGAKVPIILTSRADSVMARLASCAVASLVAATRRDVAAKAIAA